jgi:hypothetical protein
MCCIKMGGMLLHGLGCFDEPWCILSPTKIQLLPVSYRVLFLLFEGFAHEDTTEERRIRTSKDMSTSLQ